MALDREDIESLDVEFFAKVTDILGKRGTGKSYTAGVMLEEAHELGVPFVVLDPQGANLGLKELKGVEVANPNKEPAEKLARYFEKENKSLIINLKSLPSVAAMQNYTAHFLNTLWRSQRRAIRCIVVDEIHILAPQGKDNPGKDAIKRGVTTKRSDGFGFILITQRAAAADKTILSQADNIILHRLVYPRDISVAKELLENVTGKDELKEALGTLQTLKNGEVIFIKEPE